MTAKENSNTSNETAKTAYRPKVSFFHPNGRGTGGAAEFELHPATNMEEGSLYATFVRQKTVGVRDGEIRTFPSFDWEHRITVKLNLTDLSKMLEVFRGVTESLEDGKGLFARGEKANVIFKMEHRVEPQPGFLFEAWRKAIDGDAEPERAGIVLTTTEAFGLSLAIEQSMRYVAFGIPENK